MKKVILILFTVTFLALTVRGQDAVKLSASFSNTDLSFDNLQGVSGEVDVRLIKPGNFRVGGVFQYIRTCFDCGPKVDVFSGGPQVSYDFGKRLTVFGRALFGTTTTYNGDHRFTRTYGFGGDINLGHFFIRPFAMDFQRIEGVPLTTNRYSSGLGLRF